jgi:hypothetical protein
MSEQSVPVFCGTCEYRRAKMTEKPCNTCPVPNSTAYTNCRRSKKA